VETKNKRCVEKYKNRTDFRTYEQVRHLKEFAGILSRNAILVDVDDGEQAEKLMGIVEALQLNCRVYQTTRGKHFLFLNTKIDKCYTHATLAIGLTADIKSGFTNSYEVLKINGEERWIEWDVDEGQSYQEIPRWLFPVRASVDFAGMKAGDGRNQALFNYILTLGANGFSVEESRECIRIINRFILPDPLSDEELEVILRDEAFQKPIFFRGQTFLFDRFAQYLRNNSHILRINNQLHIYDGGLYRPGYGAIEGAMISLIPDLRQSARTEVLKYLEILIRDNTPAVPAHILAFRNGLLNVLTGEFFPPSPEHIITNRIEWDYNPSAHDALTEATLNKIACNDPDIRALLEEAAGYALFRRNELGKAFILTGTGSNGKSTFLNMLKHMLGRDNVSSLDLKKLGDRFSTVLMFGKLANIGDDISDEFVVDTSIFKKIVTGETIEAEHKGQPVFEFEPFVKLFFSANTIPRMGKGRDWEAIKRRLIIIPFNAKFSREDPDFVPFIGDELKRPEAIETLIRLGVEGLRRVLENREFTRSEKVERELMDYEESNNPLLTFVRECAEEEFFIENAPTGEVYHRYAEFCLANNLKPMSRIEFTKSLNRQLNLEVSVRRLGKRTVRVFRKRQ
jgi:putative DNA primase/helicase